MLPSVGVKTNRIQAGVSRNEISTNTCVTIWGVLGMAAGAKPINTPPALRALHGFGSATFAD